MTSVTIIASLLALASAFPKGVVWTKSHATVTKRRLTIDTVESHNDTSDKDCMVGGHDDADPEKIYLGGPCSELTDSGPKANFRYIEMYVLGQRVLTKRGAEVDFERPPGTKIKPVKEDGSLAARISNMKVQKLKGLPDVPKAGLFSSTTSYLSKAKFGFYKNAFLVGDGKKEIDICVTQCNEGSCDSYPGTADCKCKDGKCNEKNISVVPGQYKFSVLAAAFNMDQATTGGWETLAANYGEGGVLKGELDIFQALDFTNMKVDELGVIDLKGKQANFSTMQACNLSAVVNCTKYTVGKLSVAAKDWEGVIYEFPQYYNTGAWTEGTAGFTSTPDMTRDVDIECIKVSPESLIDMDDEMTLAEAKAQKILILKYNFDLSGITATKNTGRYFVYDPTVSSATSTAGKKAAGVKDTNTTKKGTGQMSAGRFAAGPVWFILVLCAATVSKFF